MSAKIISFPRPVSHRRRRLPFVVDRKRAGLPPPTGEQSPRCFWRVSPIGDYERDIETGNRLAVKYLDRGGWPPLQWIVADMPRELTGVEVGFLRLIGLAAASSGGVWHTINERDSRVMAEVRKRDG